MARRQARCGCQAAAQEGPRAGEGLLRQQEPLVPGGQRAGHAQRAVRVPRPPCEEGRVPSSVDPADQRRLPAERHELQPLHRRPQRGRHRGRPQGAGRHRHHRSGDVHGVGRGRRGRRSERTARLHQSEGPTTAAPPGAPQCAYGGRRVRRRGRDADRAKRSPPVGTSRPSTSRQVPWRCRAARCSSSRRRRARAGRHRRRVRNPTSPSSAFRNAARRSTAASFVLVADALERPGQSRHDPAVGRSSGRRCRRAHAGIGRPVQPEGRAGQRRRAVPRPVVVADLGEVARGRGLRARSARRRIGGRRPHRGRLDGPGGDRRRQRGARPGRRRCRSTSGSRSSITAEPRA